MSQLVQHLVAQAEEYARRRRLSLSRVGHLAAGDGKFFTRLKDGTGTTTIDRYESVRAWLEANMPPEPPVPAGEAAA